MEIYLRADEIIIISKLVLIALIPLIFSYVICRFTKTVLFVGLVVTSAIMLYGLNGLEKSNCGWACGLVAPIIYIPAIVLGWVSAAIASIFPPIPSIPAHIRNDKRFILCYSTSPGILIFLMSLVISGNIKYPVMILSVLVVIVGVVTYKEKITN